MSAGEPAPAPPPGADVLFGDALPALTRYADRLAGDGIERGLLGPREVPRLWDRHLLNSAAVATLLPAGATAVDVGTGAGLPGMVVALVRPDVAMTLVDSTARRTAFVSEVVDELGVGDRVRVVTGRVEERAVRDTLGRFDVVLSRAVAALPTLVRWCLPLTAPGGTVLAVKGARARDEVTETREAVRRAGAVVTEVHDLPFGDQTTTVVALQRRPRPVSRETRGAQ